MSARPTLDVQTVVSEDLDTEIVGVFASSQGGPWFQADSLKAYKGAIEKLVKTQSFAADYGTLRFVRFGGQGPIQNVLFVGLGVAAELTLEKIRRVAGRVAAQLKTEKSRANVFMLESWGVQDLKGTPQGVARAFAEGFVLSHYQFDQHKQGAQSKESKSSKSAGDKKAMRLSIYTAALKGKELLALKNDIVQVDAVAASVQITRDWSNQPSNFGTPEFYAQEAKKLASSYGLKIKILNQKDAEREKMGLFLGVGRGSERENRLVIVEYTPKNAPKKGLKTVALVGKGVTFDSGGISIKPSLRMEDMKHDMTGAATVMGAIVLAAQWKVPHRVIAMMAFAENMPDGKAIQPGNVLTSRSGKTVEILNTDAEGRLVLADALDLVQDYKPDAIVDVATLTGAVSIALGKHCCGVLGNDQGVIDQLSQAGNSSGERMWQLPMFEEYLEDLKSEHADLRNSVNDSYAGTVRGAMFLKQFIKDGQRWAHLDIAGTAYNMGHVSYFPKHGASGAYVRTLARFVADFQ